MTIPEENEVLEGLSDSSFEIDMEMVPEKNKRKFGMDHQGPPSSSDESKTSLFGSKVRARNSLGANFFDISN